MKYFSQKGQDEWALDILNHKKHGYFVDVGASDGVGLSNTLTMERELGWKGLCIEPNPVFFERLKINRKCALSTDVVDFKNGNIVTFRVDNNALGGIVADDTDNNIAVRGSPSHIAHERPGWRPLAMATTMSRETKTLDVLLENAQAPSIIDFLSLDVEGAETRVLKNFPFDRYVFLTAVIERPQPELEKILFTHGYVFVRESSTWNDTTMPYDSFYVHRSLPNFESVEKMPHVKIPRKDW